MVEFDKGMAVKKTVVLFGIVASRQTCCQANEPYARHFNELAVADVACAGDCERRMMWPARHTKPITLR